jgi:hypothetical protein
MRRYLVVAACAMTGALAIAGAAVTVAWAQVPPPPPPAGQIMTPYTCPEYSSDGTNQQPGRSSTSPLNLRYGWGALKTSQLDEFLAIQSGSVTLENSAGTPIYTEAWGVGNSTGWSSYFNQMLTPAKDGSGPLKEGWATRKHSQFGTLAPGTYFLTVDLRIAGAVKDGFHTARAGSWVKVTDCQFTVT